VRGFGAWKGRFSALKQRLRVLEIDHAQVSHCLKA